MDTDSQIPPCSDHRLQRALSHLVSDLSRQPTLAELASIAGMGRTHFSRHFLEVIGVNLSIWSRRIRMERARELLARTDLPITTIGLMVGYGDITTFERNFRKDAGHSPRQYRRNQRAAQRARNIATFAEKRSMRAEIPAHKKI